MKLATTNVNLIPHGRCLAALLARVSNLRSYAIEADTLQHEASGAVDASPKTHSVGRQPNQQAVALWQQVAGLTGQQAQQLLQDQPKLSKFLQSGFDSSTFAQNLHLLRCHGAGIRSGAGIPAKLRAYLAVAPHQALEQAKQVEQLIAGQAIDHKLHGQQQYAVIIQQLTAHVEALVVHAGHRTRRQHLHKESTLSGLSGGAWDNTAQQQTLQLEHKRLLQKQEQQQEQMHKQQIPELVQLLGKNKRERLRSLLSSLPQLQQLDEGLLLTAAAIIEALQLQYTQPLPGDLRSKRLQEFMSIVATDDDTSQGRAEAEAAGSSSSVTRGKRRARRRPSSSVLQTMPAHHTMFSALCTVLFSTLRRVDIKPQPMPTPQSAALLARQLQLHLDSLDVLKVLLARPTLLWLQSSPGRVLAQLQQQLPDLKLKPLLMSWPGVLLIPYSQVSEVLSLLTGRLALSREQAAAVIQHHPQLLQSGASTASMNLGFLIGLGLRPNELQAMLVSSPMWITRPLKNLTVQWHFVTTVAKASKSDVVLLPDLLSLPISRLAPRILYARKRQVRLLLPSHAAMLPALSPNEWLKHKLVPLQFWITATDKRMCQAVGLDAEDYSRFKAAWIRVDAFSWSHAAAADRRNSSQQQAA